MPPRVGYAATIYFGLMMAGTLARPGWCVSPVNADPPPSVSATLAPLKKPYIYNAHARPDAGPVPYDKQPARTVGDKPNRTPPAGPPLPPATDLLR